MTPVLAALGATLLLALVAFLLAIGELNDYRMAERVRRAALGTAPAAAAPSGKGLAAIGGSLLRLIDVSGLVRLLASQQDRVQMERLVTPLGMPVALAAPLLVAVKLFFMLGAPAAAAAWHISSGREGSILVTVLVGLGVGVLLPNTILTKLRNRRVANLNRAMADTLDLLVVCAEAGLGLESAIDRVAADLRRANPAMALEFGQLAQEMRMMPDRGAALDRFAERAEVEGLKRVAATLSQSMRYGTPLGTALRALAADERNLRMIRMEEKAARLPAMLVLPLIMFILPPLFIVLVGPALVQLLDSLGSM